MNNPHKIIIANKRLSDQMLVYNSLSSTNHELERILKKVQNPPIISAMEQTAGEGRLNRKWQSLFGKGLWFSFFLKWKEKEKYHLIIFAIALALRESLLALGIKEEHLLLKWPNDVLINRKKIAGILLKSRMENQKIVGLIVGIGLNINNTMEDFDESIKKSAISLRMIDHVERDIISSLKIVITEIDKFMDSSINNHFNGIIEKWNEFSIPLGEKIRVQQIGTESLEGIYCGIDEQGALLVKINGENKRILTGDVGV